MSREQIMEQLYEENGAYHRRRHHLGRIRYDIARKLLPENLDGMRCLDFGGGDGAMATILAGAGADTFLIDPIRRALQYAQEADGRLAIAEARTYLPFPDNSFDIITMLECLEHITDQEEMDALAEVRRTLKPSGLLAISVPSVKLPVSKQHYRHYSLDDLSSKLELSGLSVVEAVPHRDLVILTDLPGGKIIRALAYGADLACRNLTGSMGIVPCSEENADDFVVLAEAR